MSHPWVKRLARNLAGYMLMLVGTVLFLPFVPGPGTPLILVGMALADWPGKKRFFSWLGGFAWFSASDEWCQKRFGFGLPCLKDETPASSDDAPAPPSHSTGSEARPKKIPA